MDIERLLAHRRRIRRTPTTSGGLRRRVAQTNSAILEASNGLRKEAQRYEREAKKES